MTTSNGLEIKGYKTHFVDRIIGSYTQKREPVEIDAIKRAIQSPVGFKQNRPAKSQPSEVYITDECRVSVNPNTGIIIQTSPRGKAE